MLPKFRSHIDSAESRMTAEPRRAGGLRLLENLADRVVSLSRHRETRVNAAKIFVRTLIRPSRE